MREAEQYISSEVIQEAARKSKKQLRIGGVCGAIALIDVIFAVTDPEYGVDVWFWVIFGGIFVWQWCRGTIGKKWIKAAEQYNSIFLNDSDGIVTISELRGQMQKKDDMILSEIQKLIDKKYLRKCTLVKTGEPHVALSNGQRAAGGFISLVCPSCGGTTRIREGIVGRCEYCGGVLDPER